MVGPLEKVLNGSDPSVVEKDGLRQAGRNSTSPLTQPFFNVANVFTYGGGIKSNPISYIEIGTSICWPLFLSLTFHFCSSLLFLVSSPILSPSLLREVS